MAGWFGQGLRGVLAVASALAAIATAAQATGTDTGARLDALLGQARDAAQVAASDARLPSPADRGIETDLDLEAVIAAASPEGDAEWECLTQALYFEARGEALEGQVAVAEVILNRRDSGRYPATVCGVVQQGTGEKWKCQFSYFCDGMADTVEDQGSWERMGRIARAMLDGAPRGLTEGAMFYHTKAVSPYWADEFFQTAEIGAHLFYREDQLQMASNASD